MSRTPAPWHVGGTFNPGSKDAHTNIWGPIPAGMQSGEIIARQVSVANARLIAAAPELLEACRIAYETLQHFSELSLLTVESVEKRIRDVIAEAEGR